MIVAEIILPLAVKSNYSYRPSPQQLEKLEVGMRVLVSFGKTKIYTGVVARLYKELDENVWSKFKPIEEVLDSIPSLNPIQLKLFRWIAFYYMATEGEVLKAALPAGLKPESALRIRMMPELEWGKLTLKDKEWNLLEALSEIPVLGFKEVAKIWGITNPVPRLKQMEARGWIELYQEVEERYKPKYKIFFRLSENCRDEKAMELALESLSRAPQQENLLMRLMSDFFQGKPTPKKETFKEINVKNAAAKALLEKGLIIEEKVQVDRLALYGYKSAKKEIKLNPAQESALSKINQSVAEKKSRPILLHGITGSGKTHIYIELIKKALAEGRQVLYLLPEITLTKQILDRIKDEIDQPIGVYHSRFNDQERVEIWQKVLQQKYKLVVGVRSAIFLPFKDLGLIVVDEEHDQSFKQNNPAPRYNARDLAVYYAQMTDCSVILGSATPSYETYANAKAGKYAMVELMERAIEAQLPEIELIDMRVERKKKQIRGIFSQRFLNAISEALSRKEQIILFQNRRGYAPFLVCNNCGFVPECINCDISLTYHKLKNHLRCHYCGHIDFLTAICPQCASANLRPAGLGTEKIEEETSNEFPEAVVVRMDTDTTRGKNSFQQIISRFEAGQIDILVGTQMVAKGLDFENVTLVGVVNADNILGFPDFRAFENAYQLLTQVSGRAGRSKKKGRVMIQTHSPDNLVLQSIVQSAPFLNLFDAEMGNRQVLNYPPAGRLIRIELSHVNREFLEQEALRIDGFLRSAFGKHLLGPDYPLVARVRNRYRMQFLLKLDKQWETAKVRELLEAQANRYYAQADIKSLRIIFDVDPL